MVGERKLLGECLRARRDQVSPSDVGLLGGDNRRVQGLRREEVALLAGVSTDYYLRLEQGRDRNPSVAVLESLARALNLDHTATERLLGLAAARPRAAKRRRQRPQTVPATIMHLLDTVGLPAFVEDPHFDVLAANPLAAALSPSFQAGENRLRSMFLDAGDRALFVDWEATTAQLAAAFRVSVGSDADDARTVELVGELSLRSARFRHLWARHDVQPRVGTPASRLLHPQLGELTLMREKLAIGSTNGQLLVIWHAEPHSASAEKLSLLASLASSPGAGPPAAPENSARRTDRRIGPGP
jgi:transcriptional regulator with XRE-family HTH domain